MIAEIKLSLIIGILLVVVLGTQAVLWTLDRRRIRKSGGTAGSHPPDKQPDK